MPEVTILFYREGSEVPVLDWLEEQPEAAQDICVAALERLAAFGHTLRRPRVENLGGGLWELRAELGHVNYRILFFFYGQTAVVLAHGLTKERRLAEADLNRARQRKTRFEADPETLHIAW